MQGIKYRKVTKEAEQVFFSLLRNALWDTPIEVPKGFSRWGDVFCLALDQAAFGLIAKSAIDHSEIIGCIPPAAEKKMKDFLISTMALHIRMNDALTVAVSTLRKAGVEPVLLKGQGLARNYPLPEYRQCGDIDLYVGAENYEKAYDALVPIVKEIDDRSKIWDWMHFDAKMGSVMLEVHYKADYMRSHKTERLYKEYMSKGLSEDLCPIRFGDTDVMTPNDNFNAFYVFYHLWRHFTGSGVGLRQFCDWACFLHTRAGKLDLQYLKEILDSLNLMEPWKVLGCFLVKDLGLPESDFPFYDSRYVSKTDKVKKYVLTDGNFGKNLGQSKVKKGKYFLDKFTSFKFHLSRDCRMFRIFPKHTCLVFWYVFRTGISNVFRDLFKRK